LETMASSKSTVTFASAKVKRLHADDTLPAKFKRMLDGYPLAQMFDGKRVAVKMHVGDKLGYTTIRPLFVRILIERLKAAGASYPFVTDGSAAIPGAVARGYTEEVLGAKVLPAAGVANKYYYSRKVGFRSLETVELCGNIVDADAMVVLSHGKGHGQSGFGGAIKNIAMGCVAGDSRGKIHRLSSTAFQWDSAACTHCYLCRDNCPTAAVSFNEAGHMYIFDHDCKYCMHCVNACPAGAITIDESGYRYFQQGMALTVREVLSTFEPGRVLYINVLMDVTPLCDCWGYSTPAIVPDVGILASDDIVAVDQASMDLIRNEDFLPGSLPEQMKLSPEGHLLQRIWGKDPYMQVEEAAALGLGSRAYKLVEID